MKNSNAMINIGNEKLTLEEFENSPFAEEFELTLKRRSKSPKGEATSKLNVRFSKGTHNKIESLADETELGKSQIAQAAIYLGLKQIEQKLNLDETEGKKIAKGLIWVSKIRQDF